MNTLERKWSLIQFWARKRLVLLIIVTLLGMLKERQKSIIWSRMIVPNALVICFGKKYKKAFLPDSQEPEIHALSSCKDQVLNFQNLRTISTGF